MRKLLILLGVIFFSEGISATPFQGQQIYRTDDRRGDFIVLTGQPLTMAEVSGTDKIQTDTLRKADYCGVGKVKIPEATPAPILRINDENPINYLSLPQISNYDCARGGLGNNAWNPATRTVYIANLEPEGEFISRIQREGSRKIALNNCGWGLVPMKYGDGTLYFKGQQYRYSQLLRTVRPPVCRKVNGAYITYFAIPLGQ
ncbi:hypothetical protein EZJ55_24680 [Microcystis aeruginosa EAWAG127a]|uniref:Uncharacterized protein n=1 Tax=Microcystis aeruginosa EAWAG127a TaxID=2529855 RepID=A0A5J5LP60_MICAE|nr:hypothetical protein [Microcystis aeruginosa]KAB0238240.1 hypothetical protein EZJ55_24535 [Microcystis aeruginosa EAWAG127a]KAB0238265.1 hypothetical protein EZJ55_24680 [Microcystis aeruginosa EAWAG127a]